MLTLGVMTVQAETTDGYELKITSPDGVGYDKVYLSVSGAPAEEIALGTVYVIPKSASIKITVQPKMGYALKGMYDANGDNMITNAGDTVYSTPSLTSDATFEIVCAPREYSLYYNGAADGYQVIGSPTKHTFGTETVLENPVKNGYTFLHWERGSDKNTKPGEGEKLGKRESDGKTVLGTSVYADGDTIYLVPVFVPNQYPVYCFDYVYNPSLPNAQGDPLGSYEAWYVDMDSIVSGKDIPAPKSYAGYHFDGSNTLYYTGCQVKVAEDGQLINVIVRLYLPNIYRLEYGVQLGDKAPDFSGSLSFVDGVSAPLSHTYNKSTKIPNPERTGYTFDSWTVQVWKDGAWVTVEERLGASSAGELILPAKREALASEEQDGELVIRLIAKLIPRQFHVDYTLDDNGEASFDPSLYDTYTYDLALVIPDPVRPGYHFDGWFLTVGDASAVLIPSADGKTVIDGQYLSDLTLRAKWTVKHYEVVLDGTSVRLDAIYDQPFAPSHIQIPTREGYKFLGFYTDATTDGLTPWIDADGNPTNSIWTLDSTTLLENGRYEVTLIPRWEINEYPITIVPFDTLPDFVEVYLNGTRYDGTAQSFVYQSEVVIVIKVLNTEYKLTAINTESVGEPEETASGRIYTVRYTVGTSNELRLTVLPMIDASGVRIDFTAETLILPMGAYRLYCDDEIFSVIVDENGKYLIARGEQAGVEADCFLIPENFFGNTLKVRMYGVAHVNADRDLLFELPERPPAPEKGSGAGYWIIDIMPSLNTVKITMAQSTQGYFEYACVPKGTDVKDLVWVALYTDENGLLTVPGLQFGTDYDVYIRVRAVETDAANQIVGAPHGEAFGPYSLRTRHVTYIDGICADLEALKTGGEMVDALIDRTIADIRAIDELHPAVQEEVEAILAVFAVDLQLAENQDYMIAALYAKLAEKIATNQFDNQGQAALGAIVVNAEAQIKAVSTSEELTELSVRLEQINLIFGEALRQMGNVPISYLYYRDHRLSVSFGLLQGSEWTVTMGDYEGLAEAIENAIRTGNVAMDGNGINRGELSSMVVRARYDMTLRLPLGAIPENGVYEIRLLLPEELRDSSLGMQVAYYSEGTGELVVLDTRRDGDYIVFKSTRSGISSFVILCDEEINLTGLMIGFSATLLVQLIAIAYLLVRRSKSAKMSRRYSVALPAVLAFQFLPANSLVITVVLGALVVIAQIVLTVLLISTHVTYRYKDGSTPKPLNTRRRLQARELPEDETVEDDTPAYEPLDTPDYRENEPLLIALSEEEISEDETYEEIFADETDTPEDEDAIFTFAAEEMTVNADGGEEAETEDPFGFFASAPAYTEEHFEEAYATEETYGDTQTAETDDDYAELSWPTAEEDETQTVETSDAEIEGVTEIVWADDAAEDLLDDVVDAYAAEGEEMPEIAENAPTWEHDELAPDAEEEIVYEDDYITGDPSEPVPYEDDIGGDPNPYEADGDRR